jgi:hypothetical protein
MNLLVLFSVYCTPSDPITEKNLVLALKETLFFSLWGLKTIDAFVSNQACADSIEE